MIATIIDFDYPSLPDKLRSLRGADDQAELDQHPFNKEATKPQSCLHGFSENQLSYKDFLMKPNDYDITLALSSGKSIRLDDHLQKRALNRGASCRVLNILFGPNVPKYAID